MPLDRLKAAFEERKFTDFPDLDVRAIEDAMETYAKTKDGRYIDLILDRACFSTMSAVAKRSKNDYVIGYVERLADITNIKTFVRIKRRGKTFKIFEDAFVPGGLIPSDDFEEAYERENPEDVLVGKGYDQICRNLMKEDLTQFEKNCDDFIMSYVKDARYKSLTPEPIVGYIIGKETEVKCIRIIMTCKLNDIDVETIKERVRESYV